jgi:hypothetical protein
MDSTSSYVVSNEIHWTKKDHHITSLFHKNDEDGLIRTRLAAVVLVHGNKWNIHWLSRSVEIIWIDKSSFQIDQRAL